MNGLSRLLAPAFAMLIYGVAAVMQRTAEGDPVPIVIIGTIVLALSALSWSGAALHRDRVRAVRRLSGGRVVTPTEDTFTAALARFDPSLTDVFGRGRATLAVTPAGLEWFSGMRKPVRVAVTEWPTVQRFELAELLGEFDDTVYGLRIVLESAAGTEALVFPVRRDRRGDGAPNPLDGYAIRGLIHELDQLRTAAAMEPAPTATPPLRRPRRPTAYAGRRSATALIVGLGLAAMTLSTVMYFVPNLLTYGGIGFVAMAVVAVGSVLARRSL